MDYDVIDKECGVILVNSLEDVYKIAQIGLESNNKIVSFDLNYEKDTPILTYSTKKNKLLKFAIMLNISKDKLTEPIERKLETLVDQGAEWIDVDDSVKINLTPEQEQAWNEAGGFQNFLNLLEEPADESYLMEESGINTLYEESTVSVTSEQVNQLPPNFLEALQSKGVMVDQGEGGITNITFTQEQVADGWVNAFKEHLKNPVVQENTPEAYPEGTILEFNGEIDFGDHIFYKGGNPELDSKLNKGLFYKIASDGSSKFIKGKNGEQIEVTDDIIANNFFRLLDGTKLTISKIAGNYVILLSEEGNRVILPSKIVTTSSPIFQMTYDTLEDKEEDIMLSASSIFDLIKFAVKGDDVKEYFLSDEDLMNMYQDEGEEVVDPFALKRVPGVSDEEYAEIIKRRQEGYEEPPSLKKPDMGANLLAKRELREEREQEQQKLVTEQEAILNEQLKEYGLQAYTQQDEKFVRELQDEANNVQKWAKKLLGDLTSRSYELWSLMGNKQEDLNLMPNLSKQWGAGSGGITERQLPIEPGLVPNPKTDRSSAYDPTFNPGEAFRGAKNLAERLREKGKRLRAFDQETQKMLVSPEFLEGQHLDEAASWLKEMDQQYELIIDAINATSKIFRPNLFNNYDELSNGVKVYSSRNENAWKEYIDLITVMKSLSSEDIPVTQTQTQTQTGKESVPVNIKNDIY